MALRIPPPEWVTLPEAVELVSPPLKSVQVRKAIWRAIRDRHLKLGGNIPPYPMFRLEEHTRPSASVWETGLLGDELSEIERVTHLLNDGSFEPKLKASLIRAMFEDHAENVAGSEDVSKASIAASSGLTGKPRARRSHPVKRERVKGEMRKFVERCGDLDGMKEEEMVACFKASRDTCRRARSEVLGEGELKTTTTTDKDRQTPTIDK
jgi:hypothetical protein